MLSDDGYLPLDQHHARLARRRVQMAEQAKRDRALAAIKTQVWGEPEPWTDELYSAKFENRHQVRRGWNPTAWVIERAKIFEAAYGRPSADFTRSG